MQTADVIASHLQEKKEITTDARLRERVSLANYRFALLIIQCVPNYPVRVRSRGVE